MTYLGSIRYLLLDLKNRIIEANLTIEDKAIGHRKVTLRPFIYSSCLGEHARMDTCIGGGIVLDRDVGRDILPEATARKDKG